jgi:hypothetical protein
MLKVHFPYRRARTQDRRFVPLGLILLLPIFFTSCDESLPLHEDPKSLFRGELNPEYRYIAGQLWINIFAINTFDETLQAPARLEGTMEIVLERAPEHRKTIALDRTLLVNPSILSQWTGQVTVNAGDTVQLRYRWNFVDDNGISLPDKVFKKIHDPDFPDIYYANPEKFIIKGSFQVFDKIGQVTFQTVNYIVNYYY